MLPPWHPQAFVEYFSKSLSHELQGKGVTCQNHLPLMVATKLAIPNPNRRKGTLFTPSPEVWAASSVTSIGKGASVIPYWAHRLQVPPPSSPSPAADCPAHAAAASARVAGWACGGAGSGGGGAAAAPGVAGGREGFV